VPKTEAKVRHRKESAADIINDEKRIDGKGLTFDQEVVVVGDLVKEA
jgi:hypothetical protein